MTQFFQQPKSLTVREIVALTGATARDGARLEAVVTGIAALDRARPGDLTFLDDERFIDALAMMRAGVCITTERLAAGAPRTLIVLQSPEPFRDFVAVARKLYPDSLRPRSLFDVQVVAPGAIVHPTAEIEDGVTVDPGAVVGPRAGIGSGTVIAANAVIGPDVQIGRDCVIGPGASIVHALIGDGVILRGGCRIGQDGRRDGPQVPQLGRVIIQDRVEIGANTTIDRGSDRDTWIGEGATIDNLVQIGHNCTVGRNCIIGAKIAVTADVAAGEKRLG